jgi:hypothetical protein
MIKRAWKEWKRRSAYLASGSTASTLAIVGLATAALLALASTASSAQPLARVAHALSVRDEGHLRFVSSSGSLLIDEGPVSGTLRGKVRLRFTYDGGPITSAQLTISGADWSIRARAQGKLNNPTSPTPSFRGSLTISGGSGRYARAGGSGELFGVFNRRTYALTVQAIGKLSY